MAENLFDKLGEAPIPDRVFEPPRAPETVTSFLGRLTLLHGVPFAYFVPHEQLLPAESLKFFSIDPQWLNALIGGAVSVGRPESIGFLLNKAMAGNFGILKEALTRRFRDRGMEPPKNVNYEAPTYEFSGFLLRSRILEGWPGLEVRAFRIGGQRTNGDELAMLRLDRLAADTLFGVVDGQIGILEITQPPEGLHFEVGKPENGQFRDKPERVLDIKQLVKAKGSAEFAHLALKNAQPVRVIFNFAIEG
jgi:hypothetical protein